MNATSISSSSLSSPFKLMAQYQNVATLLLIENSQAMLPLWSNLRDGYIQNIVAKLTSMHPMAQNTTFVLESMPACDDGQAAAPRQYDAPEHSLRNFRFNPNPGNRLSIGKIWDAVDFLGSARFQGSLAARHLVIVAASTPVDDIYGGSTGSPHSDPWHRLARKFTQAGIQCHIVLCSHQDKAPLMTLFEETVRAQNYIEESLPVNHNRFLIRLSTKPNDDLCTVSHDVSLTNSAPHRVLPYHSSITPKDVVTEQPLSLVSQLQQVHGLTKKKVYGAKPARKPFFREERVHKEPPVTISPLISLPQTNPGGRAPSKSRVERAIRVAQNSPTETHSRRLGLTRRASRFPTSEADNLAPPASYSNIPSDLQSPISPASLPNTYLQSFQHEARSSEPEWSHIQYPPIVPSQAQQLPQTVSSNLWQADQLNAGIDYCSLVVPTQPAAEANVAPAIQKSQNHSNYGEATPCRLSRRVSCAEDEEPFTFDAEYVAATAALFKSEVLPAYPNFPLLHDVANQSCGDPAPPRHALCVAKEFAPSGLPPPYNTGELYGNARQGELLNHLSFDYPIGAEPPDLGYAISYFSDTSSSLTGWAG